MKFRKYLVSNSSSSSFVINCGADTECPADNCPLKTKKTISQSDYLIICMLCTNREALKRIKKQISKVEKTLEIEDLVGK